MINQQYNQKMTNTCHLKTAGHTKDNRTNSSNKIAADDGDPDTEGVGYYP